LAAVSVGRFKDLDEAAGLIQYHEPHA
jgi:hypothetical protein